MAYYLKLNNSDEVRALTEAFSPFSMSTSAHRDLYMKLLQLSNDHDDVLFDFVLEAVRNARADGVNKYGRDEWKEQTIEEQLEHIVDHVADYQTGIKPDEDHASHAVCRALFWYGLIQMQREADLAAAERKASGR